MTWKNYWFVYKIVKKTEKNSLVYQLQKKCTSFFFKTHMSSCLTSPKFIKFYSCRLEVTNICSQQMSVNFE